MAVLFIIILIIAVAYLLAQNTGSAKRISHPGQSGASTMRCPTCDAPVRVNGNRWECTWCNDFGSCSPGEVTVTITYDPKK